MNWLPRSFVIPLLIAFAPCSLTTRPAGAGICGTSSAAIAVHVASTDAKSPQLSCSQTSGIGCHWDPTLVIQGDVGQSYNLYVVAADIPLGGFDKIEFGIDYDGAAGQGVDVVSWQSCAPVQTPLNGWPNPGGGIQLQFTSCRGTVPDTLDDAGNGMAVLGWFTVNVESEDAFKIVPLYYREHPMLRINQCAYGEALVALHRLGSAGFGSVPGSSPCPHADVFSTICCFGDSCGYADPTCCMDQGGEPLYYASECSAASCAVPVEAWTWGRIKARFTTTPDPGGSTAPRR